MKGRRVNKLQVIPYEVIPYDVDDELGLAAGGLVLSFEVMSSESVLLL